MTFHKRLFIATKRVGKNLMSIYSPLYLFLVNRHIQTLLYIKRASHKWKQWLYNYFKISYGYPLMPVYTQ